MESEDRFTEIKNGVKTIGKSISVSIMRLDKQVIWALDSKNQICREQPIIQNNKNKSPISSIEGLKSKLTKIGEEKILNYDCDVYTSSSKYPSKYWFSKDYDLILKTETGAEGNKSICEAIDLHFEKQDDSLFEIPQGFKVIKLKITPQEEIDKQPPVTLSDIEKSLFSKMESIKLSLSEYAEFRDLTADEINILRRSFALGTNLEEVPNKEVEKISMNHENPVFILEWSKNQMCNFWYDKENGYIYVDKYQVFHEEREEHEIDVNWLKKYADGGYQFKPSQEIEKIIKR
jgi:hypothetical protein